MDYGLRCAAEARVICFWLGLSVLVCLFEYQVAILWGSSMAWEVIPAPALCWLDAPGVGPTQYQRCFHVWWCNPASDIRVWLANSAEESKYSWYLHYQWLCKQGWVCTASLAAMKCLINYKCHLPNDIMYCLNIKFSHWNAFLSCSKLTSTWRMLAQYSLLVRSLQKINYPYGYIRIHIAEVEN